MIFCDLEKIYRERNISNKYILTLLVSTRARQLSEQKGRLLDGESSERYITYALEEVQKGDLAVGELPAPICAQAVYGEHADATATSDATVGA